MTVRRRDMARDTAPTRAQPLPGELLLVGTNPTLTGQERLLAGTRDGEHLLLLVETHRPSNTSLLGADSIYVHVNDRVERRPVIERRPLTDQERDRFDAATPSTIGADLEVLTLGAASAPASASPGAKTDADANGTELQSLSESRCWELLQHATVGRLAVVFNGAPDIYPVNHAVIDDTIVIRTAPGTKLVAAIDHAVAFEVDHLDHAGHKGWSVVVHGTAEEPRKIEDYLQALDDGPTPWAAGARDRFIVIRPTSVTGRVLPPIATGVALSPAGR